MNQKQFSVGSDISELSTISLVLGLRKLGHVATLEQNGDTREIYTSAPLSTVRREAELRSISRDQLLRSWAA